MSADNKTFRPCASVLLYRVEAGEVQFLLVHKPRTNDAWQLPQGGVEPKEAVPEAALRELQEEAGVTGIFVQQAAITYTYDFPDSFRSYRPDNVIGQSVHFIIAHAVPPAVVQVDNHEIDNHAWITIEQMPTYIQRAAYAECIQAVYSELLQLLEVHED